MTVLRSGKILAILAVLLVVLLAVGVFLPAIAAATVGRGIVAGAVEGMVDGSVAVDAVSFSWGAPQRVHGLRITDRSGREAADLNVEIASGFLPIVLGASDAFERVALSGELRGTLREDGSSSFQTLVAADEPDPAAAPQPPLTPPPARDGGALPRVRLDIDALKVSLALEATPGDGAASGSPATIVLDGLAGHVDFTPGGAISVDLASPATTAGGKGRVAVKIAANGLVDSAGALRPRGATLDAAMNLEALPVPFDDGGRTISRLELTLASANLADDLAIHLVADTAGDGADSTLRGDITLDAPLRDDGSPNVALTSIRGTLSGERVPTALLQPLLAGSAFVLARDLGPTVDVDATFTPVSAGAKAGSDVEINVTASPHASLEVAANVGADGAVSGTKLDARLLLRPALVAGLLDAADGPALGQPVPLHLHADSFHLPAPGASGRTLAGLAFDGTLETGAPIEVVLPAEAGEPLVVRDATLALTTAALGEGLRVAGGAGVAGGRLEIDQRVSKLLDAEGGFDFAAATPDGTIALRGLDGAVVASLLGIFGTGGERTAVDVLIADELASGPVDLVVTTKAAGGNLAGEAVLATRNVKATVGAERANDRITVTPQVEMTLLPVHVATLLAGNENPVALAGPVRAGLRVEPFELPAGIFDAEGSLPDVPIRTRLAIDAFRLEREDAATILVSGFAADLGASLRGQADVSLEAGARIFRDDGTPIGVFACDLVADTGADRFAPRGTVTLTEVAVPAAEAILGLTPDTIAGWTGSPGSLTLAFTADDGTRRVTTKCAFPNLNGEAVASVADDVLSVESEGLAMTVRAATLERLLNTPPEDGAATPATRLTVADDVPMKAILRRVRFPLGLESDAPPAASDYAIDVALDGGPLKITGADGVASTLDTLSLTLSSSDFSRGVDFTVAGRSAAVAPAEPGRLDIAGRVTDVLNAEGRPDFAAAKLDMKAETEHVPTILADAALGMQQLLVAALGVEMKSDFTAAGFSRSAGRIDGSIVTPNGDLTGALVAKPGLLVSVDEAPLYGSLEVTPALRERLLRKIHPILADVRTTEDRLRFRATGPLQLPTDGDVTKLNGDFEITTGKVEFTAGSKTLGLMGLFMANPNESIPGSIDPIIVHLRDGIVTYDRFTVNIDKYTMLYQGKIDLPNDRVDLRTEVPLEALGRSFEEMKGYVDRLVVPIVTRGSIGDPKTEIDPEFDLAGAAVESGLGGLIDDALKEKGIGDLLGDLFKGEKKK